MASWMIHLRVAQGIYRQLGLKHIDEFIMGNIAPDSGIPTADGTGYQPDAEVSHFRTIDQNGMCMRSALRSGFLMKDCEKATMAEPMRFISDI